MMRLWDSHAYRHQPLPQLVGRDQQKLNGGIAPRSEAIRSGFAPMKSVMETFSIYDLERRIDERASVGADVSYTRKLLDRGVAQCAKKLGEEAVELALASVTESRERLIEESADLLYHLLVLLKARDIKLAEVEAVLGARASQSGLAEKASRKGG
jgi:phosphoribosyl-ATP pyrophosphohydrolase